MSWVNDVLSAVHRVVLLEERVSRLDASVEGLTDKITDTRDRLIRLEGLIEGALRTYNPRSSLPPPDR